MVHHSLAHSGEGLDVFQKTYHHVTAAASCLSAANAQAELDRLLSVCLCKSLPVYVCVPLDVQDEAVVLAEPYPVEDGTAPAVSDAVQLEAAVTLIAHWANSAARPVILADVARDPPRHMHASH